MYRNTDSKNDFVVAWPKHSSMGFLALYPRYKWNAAYYPRF